MLPVRRERAKRILASVACLVPAALAWTWSADGSRPGAWVLGLYRERSFAVNLALSYLGVWAMLAIGLRLGARTLGRGLLATSGLVACVLACELVAILGWVDFRALFGERPPMPDFAHQLRRTGAPNQAWEGPIHFDLADWLGAPAGAQGQVAYATDRFGLRNPPGKDDARIVLLGDSILVGSNVDADDLIAQRLQEQVGVQVIGVAQVQYAPQESLNLLRSTGLALGGRTVLHFIFEGNDLADSKSWHAWLERPFRSDWPASGLLKSLARPLKWSRRTGASQARHGWVRSGGERQQVCFLYDARRIDADLDEWPRLAAALSQARREFETQGARYEIVFVPAKIRVLHSRAEWPPGGYFESPTTWDSAFRDALSVFCKREGIAFHDTSSALTACLERGELPFFPFDTHLNATGHHAVASFLAARIAAPSER
jgi:hypothetical protein